MGNGDDWETREPSPFLSKLIDRACGPKLFSAFFRCSRDPEELNKPYSLAQILEIPDNPTNGLVQKTLLALEEELPSSNASWLDFKWRLMALLQIQDIFDASFFSDTPVSNVFQLWYFYFESKYLITESILSGLNGHYASSASLLRPFLEFSLLQNYYFRTVNNQRSYKPLDEYFKRGTHPSWNTVIRGALSSDSFSRPVKFRLACHLQGLTKSSAHAYHPLDSPRQYADKPSVVSLEGLYFWHATSLAIQSALWCYYLNFPMLFFPADTTRKFGFNSPVGLFIDEYTAKIIKMTLSADDFLAFHEYASNQEPVPSLRQWYEGFPNLTDEQILKTWEVEDGSECPGIFEGYCQQMAKMRALREAMALERRPEEPKQLPDTIVNGAQSLKGWRHFSKIHGKQPNAK